VRKPATVMPASTNTMNSFRCVLDFMIAAALWVVYAELPPAWRARALAAMRTEALRARAKC
jgi:hypothetical protein